jgi:hypothetical protein
MVLNILCKKSTIQLGGIKIRLDGQHALLVASKEWPLNIAQPDFYLLKDIHAKIKTNTGDSVALDQRSSQDDDVDNHNLDSWAKKNNIQADTMEKLYWNHCKTIGKSLPNLEFNDKGWT